MLANPVWKAIFVTPLALARLVFSAYNYESDSGTIFDFDLLGRQSSGNIAPSCSLDQTQPPGNLTFCGNSTLFTVWRPKARFIAPEGWMNDPQGEFTVVSFFYFGK
jgi:hypothetical protein